MVLRVTRYVAIRAPVLTILLSLPNYYVTTYLVTLGYTTLFGPLHWVSRRQSITAASSAEAEIYATDECVKFLLELVQIMEFLDIKHLFMPSVNIVYNDNKACINWSKTCTTKGLRHIQMRENRIRENVLSKFVSIRHIDGKHNLADVFTKEMKDTGHFVMLRDLMMCPRYLPPG